jgi:hypothetical protein
MARRVSMSTRSELVAAIRERYRCSQQGVPNDDPMPNIADDPAVAAMGF